MQTLEHEHRLAARERETLTETAAKLHGREQDLRNREETFRRRLEERIEERLRDARREIDAVVEALKARTDALASDAERRVGTPHPDGGDRRGAGGRPRRDRRHRGAARARPRRASASTPSRPSRAGRPLVGDRVLVGAFGLEGVVQALHDREAEVDVRGKRLRARIDELQVADAARPAAPPARVRVNVELQPREGSITELNVIGCHVDEALSRTEKFLDEALLSELESVRLIHGYGTGQLRQAIAGFLQTQPFVAHFAPAPPEQGGGGVTVVELKE